MVDLTVKIANVCEEIMCSFLFISWGRVGGCVGSSVEHGAAWICCLWCLCTWDPCRHLMYCATSRAWGLLLNLIRNTALLSHSVSQHCALLSHSVSH